MILNPVSAELLSRLRLTCTSCRADVGEAVGLFVGAGASFLDGLAVGGAGVSEAKSWAAKKACSACKPNLKVGLD